MDLADFSPTVLLAGLIFGVVGWYLFREGKRRLNHPVMVIGILLMAYPIFVPGPKTNIAVGVSLCAFAYYFWQ